jgi:hypothetical protein
MNERLPSVVYWRRRALVAAGAVAAAAAVWFGPDAVDAITKHNDDPIPAGCTTNLRDGQTYWDIAQQIDDRAGQDTGEVAWMLGRANPGVSAGELQPGLINVPEVYCDIVKQPGFNQ